MTFTYTYSDAGGAYLGSITRNVNDAGKKTFRASKGFPDPPRPLYGLARLAQRPDAPVLVVEGEKAADAAGKTFPDYVCVTSPFGAQSAAKADWTPLAGRDVTVWPDHDAAGAKYAADVVQLAPHAKVVPLPGSFPEGWDLADDLPSGVTVEVLLGLLQLAEAPKPKKPKPKPKPKPDLKQTVEEAKRHRDDLLRKIKALLSNEGRTEEEAKVYTAKARELAMEYLSLYGGNEEDLEAAMADVAAEDELGSDIDGDALLDSVRSFYLRFVSYPSVHAVVAHTLWTVHAHMMDAWDSTPRIAFSAPEKASGKTRALEVTKLLTPRPILSLNASPAYLIRKMGDAAGLPTVLQDEFDNLFSGKDTDYRELRALYNAGHRRGEVVGRCVAQGKDQVPVDFPAYCAVALAGIGGLPDTISSRSIIIEMRRRAPDETIEPLRPRIHEKQAKPIYYGLVAWCRYTAKQFTGEYPELPAEIVDRHADMWEPLLVIADAAGGDWPELAREAAVFLVRRGKEQAITTGVELLQHIREAFGEEDRLWTDKLLAHLHNRDESPWAEDGRRPALNGRRLATRLKQYGIRSKQIKIGGLNRMGYAADDFADAWKRYLDLPPGLSVGPTYPTAPTALNGKGNLVGATVEVGEEADRGPEDAEPLFPSTSPTPTPNPTFSGNENNTVGAVGAVGPTGEGEGADEAPDGKCTACGGFGCPTCRPETYGMKPRPAGGYGPH